LSKSQDGYISAVAGSMNGIGVIGHNLKGLKEYTLIYRSGYNILAKISYQQKRLACIYISKHGPFVQSSTTNNCFCASSILCAEITILEGLRVARVPSIICFCYGMKSPVVTLLKFDNIMTTGFHQQVDLGTNIQTSTIPLFLTYHFSDVF
jgi:hypothetical protein